MTTVLVTFGIFVIIILALTIMIVVAERYLVNHGNVTIIINDSAGEPLQTEAGRTLLNTLVDNDILLPSACGGQGTCGTCTCKVFEGGGDILPTEQTFVNRKMAKKGYRLSCQVKVKNDMQIEVPEEVFSIKKWECEVVSNTSVATFIKEFVVRLPEGETIDFKPGGYIQIEVPKVFIDFSKDIEIPDTYREDWDMWGIFNLKLKNSEDVVRAYSMANHPAEGDIIMLNVRIATPPWDKKKKQFVNVPPGIVSSYIFSRQTGDTVTISGPYGEFFIQDTDREMIYIGGGAGMAPMRSHIYHLFHTVKTKRKVSFWYGARSKREIFYDQEFKSIAKNNQNFTYHVGLSEPLPEDKWRGYKGFIHYIVYEQYLKDHPAPEDCEYYLCGPPVMIDAVEEMLYNLGVEPEMIRYDKF